MKQAIEPRADSSENVDWPLPREVVFYLAIAFGFSWTAWVVAIKLHWGEELLNIGTAGPALAALILSRRRALRNRNSWAGWICLLVVLAASWIVLSLHYLWRSSSGPSFHLNPLLLIPALLPAWIISRVFGADDGVRGLARRLVQRPDRWTVFALLYFPLLLGLPTAIAGLLHAPIMWPEPHGSALATIATGTIFFLYNLLFVGTLEEPGWRGFLLDRLQLKFSPLLASLLVWLPWALWHAPLDYYRPVRFSLTEYILLRVVFLIPLTIILTWFYNRSGRSIQSTAVFHACMNTFPFVAPYYQPAWVLIFLFAAYSVVRGRMWSPLPQAAARALANASI